MRAPVPPNISPKPMIQKQGVPMQKSIMFFIRMLPVFLARVRPASQRAKPACMKYTRNAATSVQMTFAELYIYNLSSLIPKTIPGKTKAPGRIFSCPASLPWF